MAKEILTELRKLKEILTHIVGTSSLSKEEQLHPTLQVNLIKYLTSLSSNIQLILNTHSPYFYKNCLANKNIELLISQKDDFNKISLANTGHSFGLFPWSPSWSEINYRAFSMPTVEFQPLSARSLQDDKGWAR